MVKFEATVTSKGQVTLPARLRSSLKVKPGDKLLFVQDDTGAVRVEAKTHTLADLRGFVRDAAPHTTSEKIARWVDEAHGGRWRRGQGSKDGGARRQPK